jgi:hypothetical protein
MGSPFEDNSHDCSEEASYDVELIDGEMCMWEYNLIKKILVSLFGALGMLFLPESKLTGCKELP